MLFSSNIYNFLIFVPFRFTPCYGSVDVRIFLAARAEQAYQNFSCTGRVGHVYNALFTVPMAK